MHFIMANYVKNVFGENAIKGIKSFQIIEKKTFSGFLNKPIEASGFAYKSQYLLLILRRSLHKLSF